MPKLRMRCRDCGSTEVKRDAWARWDEHTQQWVLDNVFDYAHCESCDCECSIEEEEFDDTESGDAAKDKAAEPDGGGVAHSQVPPTHCA